ncbi:MAG: hypothetical protein LKE51_06455 [Selenomonas sp.]|jgi:hypothetical protein|nr:hypothetical protein [Selenomonas sp.]
MDWAKGYALVALTAIISEYTRTKVDYQFVGMIIEAVAGFIAIAATIVMLVYLADKCIDRYNQTHDTVIEKSSWQVHEQ